VIAHEYTPVPLLAPAESGHAVAGTAHGITLHADVVRVLVTGRKLTNAMFAGQETVKDVASAVGTCDVGVKLNQLDLLDLAAKHLVDENFCVETKKSSEVVGQLLDAGRTADELLSESEDARLDAVLLELKELVVVLIQCVVNYRLILVLLVPADQPGLG
jgi:hypothetical protein